MTKPRETIEVEETLLIRMCAVHRLPPEWDFDEYKIILQVYHGSRPIAEPLHTIFQTKTKSFYDRIVFDSWLESKLTKIFVLPRESRIVLTLFSRHMVTFTFICLHLFVYIYLFTFFSSISGNGRQRDQICSYRTWMVLFTIIQL